MLSLLAQITVGSAAIAYSAVQPATLRTMAHPSPHTNCFAPTTPRRAAEVRMGFFDNLLKEGYFDRAKSHPQRSMRHVIIAKLTVKLDNFADDAAMRRLGNGAKFYGKRRSSFYGEDDADRKKDPQVADPEEDWRGPAGGSYFVPSKERDEQGRPIGFLTRKEARAQKEAEEAEKWEAARKAQSMLEDFSKAVRRDKE